jgi:hypothetical protein
MSGRQYRCHRAQAGKWSGQRVFEEQQIEEVLSRMGKTGEVSRQKELSDTNICMWTFFCEAAILHYSCAELRRTAYGSEESRVVQE